VRGGVGDLASIYSLNELGSFLWRHLKPPRTLDELVRLVVDEYEVADEIARRDVQVFLDTIKASGLINETNPQTSIRNAQEIATAPGREVAHAEMR
jgi:hypothetical protein